MIIIREKIILEQKEFGLVDSLRNKIAKKLSGSIKKEIQKRNSALDTKLYKVISDKPTRTKIYKEANDRGARISRLRLGYPQSPMVISNNQANNLANASDIVASYKNPQRRVNKLKKSVKNGKTSHQIIIPPHTKEIDKIAHEIGHISNSTSKNPLISQTHSKAGKFYNESSRRFNMLTSKMGTHKRSGLKSIIQDIANEERIIAEEKRASKKGLKILKKAGASKEDLIHAKENYKTALDSYKGKGRANWKSTIRNTIQTKDKKGESFRND